MRKCEQCGYLLAEAWDACKRCGAAVAAKVPVTPAATTVNAPATAAPPTPSWGGARTGATPPPAPPAAIGGGFDPRYATSVRLGFPTTDPSGPTPGHGGWEPAPIITPARPQSPLPALLGVLVVIGLVAGGWFGLQKLRSAPALPDEATSYIEDGAGVTHAPFNQGYSVRLPKQPEETTQTFSEGGITVAMTMAIATSEGHYEVGVGSMDMGITPPADQLDELLHQSALGAANAEPGTKLLDDTRTDFEGRPALDARLKAPDGYDAHMLVIIDGTRLFVIVAHATERNDDLFEAARDSFEFTS